MFPGLNNAYPANSVVYSEMLFFVGCVACNAWERWDCCFLFMMVGRYWEIGHVTWHLHVHCPRDYHRWCESSLCWSLWCCNYGEICHVTIHIIVFLSWGESLVVRDFTVSHIGHVFGKPGMGNVMIGGIDHGCCDGVIHRGCVCSSHPHNRKSAVPLVELFRNVWNSGFWRSCFTMFPVTLCAL